MPRTPFGRVVCLSNVHNAEYEQLRAEPVDPVLSAPKRRHLFNCLTQATGREVIILSSPPKATVRRSPKWLPPVNTTFGGHRQFFCANVDAPKVRVPAAWLFYVLHVLKHARTGDLIVIDNYEFIYVVAACWLKLCRRVTFVLDYEDGKHCSDRGWPRLLSRAAEFFGRRIIQGAFVAHPILARRLPPSVPFELVPGIVTPSHRCRSTTRAGTIRFLYSGSLDRVRGVDLIIQTLPLLPESGWTLDVTGTGPMAADCARVAMESRWKGRVRFHGRIDDDTWHALAGNCDVGLNCQRESDPVSSATFPSKVFSYMSAGLIVISSRASDLPEICSNACWYYDEEMPKSLATAMTLAISDPENFRAKLDLRRVAERYSLDCTAARLRTLLERLSW